MAEAIANSMVDGNHRITFTSMGTNACVGMKAAESAISVCEEIGVDLSAHKARQLDIKELQNAERIFCMDRGHLQFVSSLSPSIAEKTTLLTDYPKARLFKKDIWDPFKMSISKFRKNRDLIKKELERIIPQL